MATTPTTTKRRHDRYLALLALILISLVLIMLVDLNTLDTLASDITAVAVTALNAGMLVAALWTSAAQRRLIILAAVLGVLMVAGVLLAAAAGSGFHPPILWVLLVVISPIVVIRRLASHDQVTNETIVGAVCAYLLIALAFSYLLLWFDTPTSMVFGSPQPSTAFPYFSLVTITTLGYGDLEPVTTSARALATMEAVFGQVFLVVFVARIVSLYRGKFTSAAQSEAE